MKVLIVTSCLLAVALAQSYGHHEHNHHHYPQHIPVIGHNGVPLEPSEVVHARKAHLAIVAETIAHRGVGNYHDNDDHYNTESYHGHQSHSGASQLYSHGAYHIPIIGHHGVPQDTPEVAAAKAAHFAAHSKAASAAAYGYHDAHYRYRRGVIFHTGAGHHGVPQDTPEVAAAKSAHFAAHAQLAQGYAHGGAIVSSGYAHNYPVHSFPALAHDGQVLETPEVVALKHAHFAAHAEANSRLGSHSYGGSYGGHNGGNHGSGYENSVVHVAPIHHGGHHSYHIPVIGHNGVPQDTPEVAAARQHHLAALAEANSRSSGYGYGHEHY